MPGGLLTQRAVVLAKIETVSGTDAVPIPTLDAILVGDPTFSIDPNVLERNFTRNDLSPLGVFIGRKLASIGFSHELRGNGIQQSGNIADAPKLATLIRACGYSLTGVTGVATIGAVVNAVGNTVDPTWVAGGANTKTDEIDYTVTVVLGGITAVAEVRATANNPADTTVLKSEVFSASVTGTSPTITLVADATDPLAVTYTVAGSFQAGDILNAVVGGTTFSHTVVAGDTDLDGAADALALVINAATDIVAPDPAAAVITVTFTNDKASTVITTTVTAMDLGDSGGTITPTWSGTLVLGDSWTVTASPPGIRMDPISAGQETMTLYAYFDGLLHKLTGALGTFTIDATAGAFGTATFTFTGQYNVVTDALLPTTGVFEDTLPPQVELAQLAWGGDTTLLVNALTYDQGNNIVPRPDMNNTDGFRGVRITSRLPTGTIDPEAELVGDFNFWNDFAAASRKSLSCRIGSVTGNIMWIKSPQLQMNSLGYGDRDGLRTFEVGIRYSRVAGNDEVRFLFV